MGGGNGCSSNETYLAKVTLFLGDIARCRKTAVTTAARKKSVSIGIMTASRTVESAVGADCGAAGASVGCRNIIIGAFCREKIPSSLDTFADTLFFRKETASAAAANGEEAFATKNCTVVVVLPGAPATDTL